MEKKVVADGPFAAIIPDGVQVGDTIYLSGAVSVDAEGTPVHEGDFLAQVRQAYANIEVTLKQFGADLTNIVKETVFVVDMAHPTGDPEEPFVEYAAVRAECLGGAGGTDVAQSLIQVASLVFPELLVEIEVEARV